MMAHAFNPNTGRQTGFEASLVYKAKSRTAWSTKRNPVPKLTKSIPKQIVIKLLRITETNVRNIKDLTDYL